MQCDVACCPNDRSVSVVREVDGKQMVICQECADYLLNVDRPSYRLAPL